MTVKELIEALEKMPKDTEVYMLWDGATRSNVRFAWVANSGKVVLADEGDDAYYLEDFPIGFIGNIYTTPRLSEKD